ncbi:BrnA antitoxin family protein [Crenothrix sp.]|uniref:BrnA antitoxin family protein n=1 Tax=Crenothrix sp. TaxID=3100433 RepID=UPI00374DCEA3
MMKDEYDFSNGVRGAVIDASGKTRITIFLDDDILAAFKERAAQSGKGYQTLINETLRGSLSPESAPLTVGTLRQILHEELRAAS